MSREVTAKNIRTAIDRIAKEIAGRVANDEFWEGEEGRGLVGKIVYRHAGETLTDWLLGNFNTEEASKK